MNRAELLDLLRGGEDSTVEFKRDVVQNYDLAKELVAFLNLDGRIVLSASRTMAASPARLEVTWKRGRLSWAEARSSRRWFRPCHRRGRPSRVGWETLLRNLKLMTESADISVATINGLLVFGSAPKRFLQQLGIRAICFPGGKPDYAGRTDEDLNGLGTVGGRRRFNPRNRPRR